MVRTTWPFGRSFTSDFQRVAVIGGDVDVGAVVAGAMAVEGHVRGRLGELRRLHLRDVGELRRAGDLLRDVGPGGARVAGDVHLAVVGSGPDDAGLRPRFRDGEEGAEDADAVVLGDLDVLALDAHQLDGVAVDREGQVGADRGPREPAVGASDRAGGRRRTASSRRGARAASACPSSSGSSSPPSAASGRIVWRSLVVRSIRLMKPSCDSA